MKRELNFLIAYKKSDAGKRKEEKSGFGRIAFWVLILNLGIATLLISGSWLYHLSVNQEVKNLRYEINESEEAKKYNYIMTVQGQYSALSHYNTLVEKAIGSLNKKPTFSKADYNVLVQTMSSGMKMVSFHFVQGEIVVRFQAGSSKDVPSYIEAIRNYSRFEQVTYHGWNTVDRGRQGSYEFEVRCTLPKEESKP